jgi:lysozyme
MKGIDVSSYQGIVPWHNLKDIEFGITKVTEGESYINPFWRDNAIHMQVEKKIRGFYHFSLPGAAGNTPEAEAAYFWSKVEHIIRKGDIIACDIEKTYLRSDKQTSDWAYRLLQHLEQLAKFRPFIYSYPDFIKTQLTDKRLSHWPLWLAWYQDDLPHSFAQWPTITLWQRGPGKIQGLSGQTDVDIFFLKANDLKKWGKP